MTGITRIWESHRTSIFYCERDGSSPQYANLCDVVDIQYKNVSGRCAYCGHELGNNLVCPGCSARLSGSRQLLSGRADVTICGYLPQALWLLRTIRVVFIHINTCGDPSMFANWEARFVLTNIEKNEQIIKGFSMTEINPIMPTIRFSCDIQLVERIWEKIKQEEVSDES